MQDPQLEQRMRDYLDRELCQAAGITGSSMPKAQVPAVKSASVQQASDAIDEAKLQAEIMQLTGEALGIPIDHLDLEENLANYGMDSIAITEVMAQISRKLDISIAPTTFFEAKNLQELCDVLQERYPKAMRLRYPQRAPQTPSVTSQPATTVSKAATSPQAVVHTQVDQWLNHYREIIKPKPKTGDAKIPAQSSETKATSDAPPEQQAVAVISMAGKFPGCPDVASFANALEEGRDCISEVPADRWDWREVYGNPKQGAFTDVKYGGFIDDIAAFDADFFNISRKEAELTDPQHRLFIQAVWHLLESGGYAPKSLAGKKVSIFLGINLQDYAHLVTQSGSIEPVQLAGLGHMFCPNRLSFLLDIQGPSQVIDTACSSSLAAIHRGVMSILHEGCEMAIAGGSNLLITPLQHILFSRVGMICADGRCKTFSSDANGYVRSDGVGAVLLKRLDLAERDGDHILGVIRASGENHGGTATSLTAPNQAAQADLIAEVQRKGNIDPRTISMIECHGTGTPLGDPIEIEGLKQAFERRYHELRLTPPAEPYCGLGSVKSNIGHTETAAGVAGLIKLLCALQSKQQYRSLHCDKLNTNIDLSGSPFHILQQPQSWERPIVDGVEVPRRAGLSSFGAGGANVHLIVEEYQAQSHQQAQQKGPYLIPLSAKKPHLLRQYASKLAQDLAHQQHSLADLAFTLQTGRDAHKCRFAVVVENQQQLHRELEAFIANQPGSYLVHQLRKRDLQSKPQPAERQDQGTAEAWVNGASFDWHALYQNADVKRVPTATYPFEATKHWIPTETAKSKTAQAALKFKKTGEGQFSLTLNESDFYHDHHRVKQTATTPGVMHMELMLQAAKQAGIRAVGLRQLLWLQPIQFSQHKTITCRLQLGSAPTVEIISDNKTHSRATLVTQKAASPASVVVPSFNTPNWQAVDHHRIYQAFDAIGLNYGPGHRGVQQVYRNTDTSRQREVWAQLQLPKAISHTQQDFELHPALMDAALQAAIGLVLEPSGPLPQETALPFAVDHIEQHAALPSQVWVHISQPSDRSGQTTKSNLTLYSSDGAVCVTIQGFTTRRLAAANATSIDRALIYQPSWQALELSAAQAPGSWQRFTLNCDHAELASQLGDDHLQTLELRGTTPAEQYNHLFGQLFLACKNLVDTHQPKGIQVLIADAQQHPFCEGLAGLLRTVASEYPNLRCQLLTTNGQPNTQTLANALRTASNSSATRFRIKDDRLFAQSAQPLDIAMETITCPWRDGGVYLITGGQGSLGQLFARDIASKTRGVTLLLLGRSTANAATHSQLESLKQQGAHAHYHQVDLADEDALNYLLEELQAQHGHIHIALHAAGILRDDYLQHKTLEQWQQVAQAKVWGSQHLAQQLEALNCEHLLLFSSLSSWFGNPGQADYAAANGFMDAMAQSWTGQMRVQSINWPLWQNGKMQMDAATQAAMRRKTGFAPLPDEAGLKLAYAALSRREKQLLALYGEAAKIKSLFDVSLKAEMSSTSTVSNFEPQTAPQPDHASLERALQRSLTQQVADLLKVDADIIELDEELTEYGFDSITFTEFTNALNESFDLDLMPTVFFQHPTLETFSAHMVGEHSAVVANVLGVKMESTSAAPAQTQKPAIESSQTETPQPIAIPTPDPVPRPQSEPIAIVGMAGLFPKAENLTQFWNNLVDGRDCIDQSAPWRFSQDDQAWIGSAGFVDSIADFDPSFFNISPAEAKMMDPQQRLLLRLAFQALEDAGYAAKSFAGSDLGIFVGTADTGYSHLLDRAYTEVEAFFGTALAPSLGPNRMSYWLDSHGPSEAVETACSSALVAIHRAVTAIRSGQCSAALVGGINTLLIPETFASFRKAGMTGNGHRCRTFSADADGYVRGEGAGVVLLKPLSDAQRDCDHIYAVIRGSAVNHGGRASSLTAPNPKAQAQLLRKTYADAQIDPATVSYIETHGTGTPLGDPIEVEALKEVFKAAGASPNSIGLGSVKSNIGHLEIASGMAGLLKLILQMQQRTLVKSLHATPRNPLLKLENSPFYVVDQNQPWQAKAKHPLRAGVSSFGFGGANAHVVLEAYDNPRASQTSTLQLPILLSAKSPQALQHRIRDLAAHLQKHPELSLRDVAFTLAIGRDSMTHRIAFMCNQRPALLQTLQDLTASRKPSHVFQNNAQNHREALAPLRQDAEFGALALSWLHNGKADKTLELWTRGLDLDWRSVFADLSAVRVPLPAYRFDHKRYWPDLEASQQRKPLPETIPAPAAPGPMSPSSNDVTPTSANPRAAAYDQLAELAAATLQMDATDFDPHINLADYGFDSITLVGFTDRINEALTLELSPADLFDYPTLEQLADGLYGHYPEAFAIAPPEAKQTSVKLDQPPQAESKQTQDAAIWAQTQWQAQPFEPSPMAIPTRRTLLFGASADTSQLPGSYEHHHLSVANVATTYANCASILLKTLQHGDLKHLQVVVPANHPADLEGLVGMLRTALQESPSLRLQLVGVDEAAKPAELSQQLNQEANSNAVYVRYLAGQRHLPELREIPIPQTKPVIDHDGLYVITGGSGALALKFASWLRAQTAAATIYALGRSQPSSSVAEQLAQAQVQYQQIDLLDAPALNDFIAHLHCEYGQIDGLIHCAGLIEDAPLSQKSAMSLHRVLEPKVTGLQNLLTACNGTNPKHLILCSSLTALFGNPGQADYAAANGYLTALAERRNQAGKTTSVIHWPLWQNGGMQIDSNKVVHMQRATGLAPLPDHIGLAAFGHLLQAKTAELAVFWGDPQQIRSTLLQPAAPAPAPVITTTTTKSVINDTHPIKQNTPKPTSKPEPSHDPDAIAIVGLSASFPDAPDLATFWQNLHDGKHSVREIPSDRWDWQAIYGDPKSEPNRSDVKWAGFIDDLHQFDPLHFGISPAEAAAMDPQQRLLLTYVWRALESAGHAPQSLAGSKTGVFMAVTGTSLLDKSNRQVDDYSATGSVSSIGPNRISYLLDLHGPSEPVETACSSTLVALHRAVAAIRNGECSQALVGGVNLLTAPEVHISFNKAGMLSNDGRCKTFSAEADGYVRGEGVGVLFVRKLRDAERNGNRILAVIKATHVNHGGRAHSLTAPNADAQAALLRETYAKAGLDPQSISYLEAHGTGTALGDPIEIAALKRVFGTAQTPHIGLGSVKTNIGHLELAAGLAGLTKVLLQMQHQTLAPTLFSSPRNPHIKLENSPFYLVDAPQPWAPPDDHPRRAGISSFGFGGVNAHVVLEQYQSSNKATAQQPQPPLWVFAAKDGDALKHIAQGLDNYLATYPHSNLTDITYTLQVGRDPHRTRLAFSASDTATARAMLQAFIADQSADYHTSGEQTDPQTRYIDTAPLIEAYLTYGDATPLLQQWCNGANVNWQSLYRDQNPQRLDLPTYPFQMMDMRTVGQAQQAQPRQDSHNITIKPTDTFVRDHIVAGSHIVAGAFTVERARAAAPNHSLQQIVWRHPIRVNDQPTTIQTKLTQLDNQQKIQITNSDDTTTHLEASTLTQSLPAPDKLDLSYLRGKLSHWQSHDIEHTYRGFTQAGISYGPSHRVICALYSHGQEVWAQLRLPAIDHASLADYSLHPSMLDGAFQACAALLQQDTSDQLLVPYAIDQLHTYQPCSGEIWVHLERTHHKPDLQRWHIDLYNQDGQAIASLKDFTLRPFPKPKASNPKQTTQPAEATEFFSELFAEVSNVPRQRFTPQTQLEDLGFDSIMVTRITDRLERIFGKLSRTLMFEFRNLAEMTAYFQQHHGETLVQQLSPHIPAQTNSPVTAPPPAIKTVSFTATSKPTPEDAIAIVGLAGRYPQADNLDAFWRNLTAGRDCVSEVPMERWNHQQYYHPDKGTPGKTYSMWGGFIEGFDHFDPLFFNISPREAAYMDPQERLFLQCAWKAIEDAGHTRASLGSQVGVFVGVMYSEYQLHGVAQSAAGGPDLALPGHPASIANRVSYFGNFQGPSMALDTMCSSSLTAIHLAINSMRNGGCRAAIAGGVNLNLHPNKFLTLAQGRFASSQGRCASFGEGGDGYVPSEGVGAVVLKPLSAALADGDHVYGIIRASALNHGGKTNGYSVPDPNAQAAVIRTAMQRAKIDPSQVSYVEAHGTGTALGDPIEISGLSKVFASNAQPCPIGSVKSNIGHGESVAGMAGLSKILLQLKHRQLVPSIHATPTNRDIDFQQTPFRLQRQLQAWQPSQDTRIAGLSSFGAGGANAHLIIEESPQSLPNIPLTQPLLFPISARNPESLQSMAQQLSDHLNHIPDTHLAHVAFTLQQGRETFEERALVIAGSCTELQAGLQQIAQQATRQVAPANVAHHLQQLAQQFLAGSLTDWPKPDSAQSLRRISLPTYVFNESRFWAPSHKPTGSSAALPLLLQPKWQASAPTTSSHQPTTVIAIELRCEIPEWTHLCHPSKELDSRYEFYATRLLEEIQSLVVKTGTQHLQVILPDHTEAHPLTGLAGLLRTASQEYPNLNINLLEIPGDANAQALASQHPPHATFQHIAWRDGQAVTKQYIPLEAQQSSIPWKDGGVYLITGGAGGLGLLFAREIASKAKNTTLILAGRSPLTTDRWTQLEPLPASVHYHQLDVADAKATQALINEVTRGHGTLNGIVHAAGITRDALIRDKDSASLMRVLAPKVSGLLNLESASRSLKLDFIILCSSVSGAFGNPGQADYATANAFMDAFAASYRGQTRLLSINWPYWREGGMQIAADQLAYLAKHHGIQPLESESGFAALYAAYASDQQQMVVMAGDRQRLLEQISPAAAPVLESEMTDPAQQGAADHSALNSYLRQTIAHVLQIAPEKLNKHSEFDRYGMDSVMSLEVVDALAKRFGSLPNSLLLDCTNLAALRAWLIAHRSEQIRTEFAALQPKSEQSPAQQSEAYPLTTSQEALWLLQQIYPDLHAYHLPMAFKIADLNLPALQQTILHVVKQNPHLQTQLEMQDEVPVQRPVLAENPLEIRFCEDPIQQSHLAVTEPFDLQSQPLLRFQLFRNGEDILLITAHHLLLDGASMALLAETLVSEYQHLCAKPNAATSLSLEPAQFAEYAAQEAAYLKSSQAQADLAYWREHLHGSRAEVALPSGSKASLSDPFASAVIEHSLTPELREHIQQCCQAWQITPATLYLGCFQLLLHGYSNQADLVIGVPHLGRQNSEQRRALGYFAGMLPLRQKLSPETTPQDFFRAVQANLKDGLAHSAYPLPALMRDINPDKGSTPLFEATFSFQNFVRQTTSQVADFQLIPQVRQKGDHPFGMEIYPEADGMRIALLYHPERYSHDLINHMLRTYAALLQQVAQQQAKQLAALHLTVRPAPQPPQDDPTLLPVHRRIAAQAALTPNATALIADDHNLSYSQLQQRVDRLAAAIAQQADVQHQPVAVLLERSADSIIAMLAIWRLGGIYLPLDHKAPVERNQRILEHSKAALVLSKAPFESTTPTYQWPAQLPVNIAPQVPVALDDIAYILYTSGSTGEPKGVVIQHRALAEHSVQAAIAYQLSPKDTVLQFTGLHLDASLEQILPILIAGGRLLLRGEDLWNAATFGERCTQYQVTLADLPPLYLADLLEAWRNHSANPPPTPRLVIVGGEALPNATIAAFQDSSFKTARLINAYGPTETVITTTIADVSQHDASKAVPIGQPLPNRHCYILDDWLLPVPDQVIGELYIGGLLASGYLNAPTQTAAAFLPDPFSSTPGTRMYRSGDRASQHNGRLHFWGRIDRQVQLRGYRVELGDIEQAIMRHPQVQQAVVMLAEQPQRLIAWYLDPSASLDPQSLGIALQKQLPSHIQPAQLISVSKMPMNTAGKVDLSALPMPNVVHDPANQPSSANERKLAQIWCQILNIEAPDTQQDFFSLGGHSLHLLKLADAIQQHFQIKIPLDQLLSHQTISAQARLLADPSASSTNLRLLREGSGTALYLFPAIGGTLAPYTELIRDLNFDGPIYGLSDEPSTTPDIDVMAQAFAQTILAQQHDQPCICLGWSMGGLLAIATAHHLDRAGKPPQRTILIESYTPSALAEIDRHLFGQLPKPLYARAAFAWDRLGDTSFAIIDEPIKTFCERLAQSLPGTNDASEIELAFSRYRGYFQAIQSYTPTPYNQPVSLLIASDVDYHDPTRGWQEYLPKLQQPVSLDGDHDSILKHNAKAISDQLRTTAKKTSS